MLSNLHVVPNYISQRRARLRASEAAILYAYADSRGIATIGVGINLQTHGYYVLRELGFDVSGTSLSGAGFVHAGQTVRLKLATYPFQRYGMLEGELLSVSADANPVRDTKAVPESEATLPGYKGVVKLKQQQLVGGMGELAISAGMQLTAEIVEGDRTVMQYLLSPVQRVTSEAGRER